ncbi:MAG TPA: HAD-IIB family hydrolase [Candidatus Paceibacterota bacterium]|jgi:HAD superfamily hydrolase (TIGR01484 family)|nr:HAD-IIB family hydrolase [Candidatus Paceibacterota bacterium]
MSKPPRPLSAYSLVIFDLDGTLAPSKSPVDPEMSELVMKLLTKTKVAIISGGGYPQFQTQFLHSLPISSESFTNLLLLPTSGTKLYAWRGNWNEQYSEQLTPAQKEKIISSLKESLLATHFFAPTKMYGEAIEDRGSQISFSALGQHAPIEAKQTWDPDRTKRETIANNLRAKIPEFDVRLGGMTTIDITKKGINKAFGIRKLEEFLKLGPDHILFIGDALFQGGNDFPAKATGVDCVQVAGPEDTKALLKSLL